MELKIYYDAYDAGGSTNGAAALRDVTLDIDTDIVSDNLSKMAAVLDDEQKALLSGFDLGGAWTSSNANLVITKVGEINTSFTTMQTIIESLQTKVNKYVENTVAADKVEFKGAEEGGASSDTPGASE